ncbi:MAG: hypothetical protein OEU92_19390 [Alphaproteobacteria bacterium]|nr:hypothetical protein [Alphaproteobacteria bacterium]
MFKRIGGALALILLIVALVGIGTGHYRSWLRHLDYSQAVHEDQSTLSSGVERELGPDQIELFVRTERDQIQRLVADRQELAAFVEDQLARLKQNRLIAKEVAAKDAELVMRLSFADADARIENYADWFYEWKRSYVLLKETVLSSAHRTVSSGGETWREAVERDISDYFMGHFTDQVLQPERREPLVEDGVRNTLEHAHSNFLQAVSDYDLRLRLFLQQHTTHFDRPSIGDDVEVELDWDAQRWKAPLYAAEDRSFDGALGVGLMVASTAGGRSLGRVLAPSMAQAIRQNINRMAARTSAQLAARASTTAAGASAGSAVPVVGSAVGAAIGFAAGAALDYMGNRVDKWLHREEFIAENTQAVASIEQAWRRALEDELHRTIDVWFDDAEVLLKELRPKSS